MGELEVDNLIFPTMGGDLPTLLQPLLGDPFDMANQWYVFGKLDLHLIFVYFSQLTIPVIDRRHSRYLSTFCLCILARYFLVHETYCVGHRSCLVVADLRSGNLAGMILAKTFNGWDAFHKKEANFFAGNPLLL